MRQKSGAYLSTISTTALPKDSPPPLVCKSPRRRGAEGKKNREEEERSERIFSVWLVRVCIKGEGGGRGGGREEDTLPNGNQESFPLWLSPTKVIESVVERGGERGGRI